MTKKIKRIAALIVAGILLICVSFASLAEEADQNLDTEYTNLEETEATEESTAEDITATEGTIESTTEEITEETTGTAAEDAEAEETSETNNDADADTTDDEYDELADENNELTVNNDEPDVNDEADANDELDTNDELDANDEPDVNDEADANDELDDEDFDELADDDYDELADDDFDELADFTEFDEIQMLDDDGGYIDPEVVNKFIPEITEEMIEASEHVGLNETETEEDSRDAKAFIKMRGTEDAYIGDMVILLAKAETLTDGIIWETRNEAWAEAMWEEIGKGTKLELVISEEYASNLFRFTLEDGTVSEEFQMNATEKPEEEIPETIAENDEENEPEAVEGIPETTEETNEENEPESNEEIQETITENSEENEAESNEEIPEMAEETSSENEPEFVEQIAEEATEESDTLETTAEENNGSETETEGSEPSEELSGEPEGNSEETSNTPDKTESEPEQDANEPAADEEAEENEVPEIHAWILVSAENDGNTVTLSAAAETVLTGVNTWQVWDAENGKWKKIGYGDQVRVEAPAGQYRFVTQDGSISEVYEFRVAEEQTETEEKPETEDLTDAEEVTEAEGQAEVEERLEAEELTEAEEQTEAVEVTEAEGEAETEEGTAIEEEIGTEEGTGIEEQTEVEVLVEGEDQEDVEGQAETEEQEEIEEQPEAVEQIPYPTDAAVSFSITWDDQPAIGGTARFTAQVSGLDDYTYTYQWQWSQDGEIWQDAEGETQAEMDLVITEENNGYLWRVNVIITGLN